jgi:hypothetical protein
MANTPENDWLIPAAVSGRPLQRNRICHIQWILVRGPAVYFLYG